jgi:zinc transport system ATP-binding protein
VTFAGVSVVQSGVTILSDVSARVPHGSWTAVIGPNGAGKSTLLSALLGQQHYSGQIHIGGDGCGRPVRIGFVPQRLQVDRGSPLTVTELLSMGQQRLPLWLGVRPRQRRRCRDLLAAVRAESLAARDVAALSGGELQRVLLALALEQEPELLVLDEPAAGVDIGGEELICGLLESLRAAHGFTQLMVSHDLSMVAAHATHVICLNRHVIAAGAPGEVLTDDVLAATFGAHMRGMDSRRMTQGPCICSTAPCRESHRD